MKVYFVRHGESDANVAGIAAGGNFETDLTKNGKNQAAKAGQDLKDKQIDLIVCSPMTRTVETAEIIAAQLGYDADKIVTTELFTERDFGKYSGGPHKEYRAAVLAGNEEGMESAQHLQARVNKGFEWLKKQGAQTVVLVSHGSTGRMIRAVKEGIHHSKIYTLDGFGNTEIYEFEL